MEKIRIVTSTPLSFPLPRIVNAPTTVAQTTDPTARD
jgi:hypothetical protein